MTQREFQIKHGLSDEDMAKIVLIKRIFNASEIIVTDKNKKELKK